MAPSKLDEYRERVAAAYKAAGILKLLAWIVVAVSLLFGAITVYELATGAVSFNAAMAALAGTALVGILSGGTAYASAVSVGLGAARLEHATSSPGFESAPSDSPEDLEL